MRAGEIISTALKQFDNVGRMKILWRCGNVCFRIFSQSGDIVAVILKQSYNHRCNLNFTFRNGKMVGISVEYGYNHITV